MALCSLEIALADVCAPPYFFNMIQAHPWADGDSRFGPLFRREVEGFLAVTGIKAYLLGEMAVGDPSFVTRLRKGASAQLSTVDRVHRWMGVHSSRAHRTGPVPDRRATWTGRSS